MKNIFKSSLYYKPTFQLQLPVKVKFHSFSLPNSKLKEKPPGFCNLSRVDLCLTLQPHS